MKFNSKLMTSATKMNHSKLLAALGELNSILQKKNQHIQISIYGGAGIMLLFPDFGRATKDIDATYDNFGEDQISMAIEEVAYQQDLPFDWLNNECQPYTWSPNGMKEGPNFSNIKVMLPPPAYLLASKLLAGRPVEKANDAYDIQFLMGKLGVNSDQAFEIFEKYFPGRKPNSFAIEEMHNRKQAKAPYKIQEFEGFTILIGRSAADNDILSMEVASPNDFWLHAASVPGSHVVVRNPDNLSELPSNVLQEAAKQAVTNSKAKGQLGVPVVLGRARDLSKPPGAAVGEIHISQYKTIKV